MHAPSCLMHVVHCGSRLRPDQRGGGGGVVPLQPTPQQILEIERVRGGACGGRLLGQLWGEVRGPKEDQRVGFGELRGVWGLARGFCGWYFCLRVHSPQPLLLVSIERGSAVFRVEVECMPHCSRLQHTTAVVSVPLRALTGFTFNLSKTVYRVLSTTALGCVTQGQEVGWGKQVPSLS